MSPMHVASCWYELGHQPMRKLFRGTETKRMLASLQSCSASASTSEAFEIRLQDVHSPHVLTSTSSLNMTIHIMQFKG